MIKAIVDISYPTGGVGTPVVSASNLCDKARVHLRSKHPAFSDTPAETEPQGLRW